MRKIRTLGLVNDHLWIHKLIHYNDSESEGDIEFYGSFSIPDTDLPCKCAIEETLLDEVSCPISVLDGSGNPTERNEIFWLKKHFQAKIIEIYKREYTVPEEVEVIQDEYSHRTIKLSFRVLSIIEIEQLEKNYLIPVYRFPCYPNVIQELGEENAPRSE